MKNIRAGALRTKVFLGRPVITKDAAGGESLTWEEFETWAAIDSLSGREWATATMLKDSVDCRITVRISPTWVPEARWRIRDKVTSQLFDLVTVLLVPKNGAAECLAKTAQGNADAR